MHNVSPSTLSYLGNYSITHTYHRFFHPSFSSYITSLSLLLHSTKISSSFLCSHIPEDVSSAVSHRSSGRERPISSVGEAARLHQRPLPRRCRLVSGAKHFRFVSFPLFWSGLLIWSGQGWEVWRSKGSSWSSQPSECTWRAAPFLRSPSSGRARLWRS